MKTAQQVVCGRCGAVRGNHQFARNRRRCLDGQSFVKTDAMRPDRIGPPRPSNDDLRTVIYSTVLKGLRRERKLTLEEVLDYALQHSPDALVQHLEDLLRELKDLAPMPSEIRIEIDRLLVAGRTREAVTLEAPYRRPFEAAE